MNYKQILDKLAELEARIEMLKAGIEMLEHGQRKQTTFPGAPTWVAQNTWPKDLDITCKGTLQ